MKLEKIKLITELTDKALKALDNTLWNLIKDETEKAHAEKDSDFVLHLYGNILGNFVGKVLVDDVCHNINVSHDEMLKFIFDVAAEGIITTQKKDRTH